MVFFDSVGNSQIQQFIYLALIKQKEKRQFLHFTTGKDLNSAKGLMEDIVNEISGRQVGMNNIVKGLLARLLFHLSSEYDFLLELRHHNGQYRPIRVYDNVNTRFIHEDFFAKLSQFIRRGSQRP